jgi:hypothetical protein
MGILGSRLTERFKDVYAKGLSHGGGVTAPVDAAGAFMHTDGDWLRLALACIDQGMKLGDRRLEQALSLVLDVVELEGEE